MSTSLRFAVNPHGINKDWNFELLATGYQDRAGSLEDVVEHIKQGYALLAGLLGGQRRSKANVIGSQWILLDVDNSDVLRDEDGKPVKDEHGQTIKIYKHQLTLEEAIAHPFIQQHCALIYTSASHTSEWHKFRLIFLLPEFISDVETYEAMVRLLMERLPHDPACKDASRVFYGNTAAEIPLLNPIAALPEDWQARAIALAEEARARREAQLLQIAERREQFNQLVRDEDWDADDLIQQALRYIPPRTPGAGNYDECRQVLMALVDYYGPSEAEVIAEQWSPSIRGTTWNIPQKIKSFRRSGISIGTLFFIAKQYGFRFPQAKSKQEWGEPNPQEYQKFEYWQQEQEQIEKAQHTEGIFQNIRKVLSRLAGRRSQPKGFAPSEIEAQPTSWEIDEYGENERQQTWEKAIKAGHRFILDQSKAGSGKSYNAGEVSPEMFGAEKVIYLTDQQRNPTTPTLAQWAGLEARHEGLVLDDKGKLRRAKASQSPVVESNCGRASAIVVLRAKGVAGADENIVCETCPMLTACKHSMGKGFGFKYQRKQALKSDRIRSHPDSLPNPESFLYADTVLICDEAGVNFKTKKTIEVTAADINETIGALADKAPEQFILLQPILSGLKKLLSEKQPRYGHPHKNIVEALPAIPNGINWDVLFNALQPDLGELNPPDEIDREEFTKETNQQLAELKKRYQQELNDLKQQEKLAIETLLTRRGKDIFSNEQERIKAEFKLKKQQLKAEFVAARKRIKEEVQREFRRVNRAVRRETAQSTTETSELLEKSVLKQWLPEFLELLSGERGDLRIIWSTLKLSFAEHRHRAIASAAKANIFMDATLSREDLALKLQCNPDEIHVCRQTKKSLNNLKITQVTDLGRMGMERGEEQQRRASAIVAHIKEQDPDAKEIDFKKFDKDGAWYRDSRGVNDFETARTLILIGTPCPNLGDLMAEYAVLTGCHDEDDPGFKAFVDRQIKANFEQAIERLRSTRRPDEELQVYVLSDFDLGIPTENVKASDITPEAASKKERFLLAAQSAMSQLVELGEKLTQTAVAHLSGYSQQYVSRHWDLLQTLLNTSNSKSGKNSESILDEGVKLFDEAIAVCKTPKQVLEFTENLFHHWLKHNQWSHFWQQLKADTQIKVLEALFLTLPMGELQTLKEAIA